MGAFTDNLLKLTEFPFSYSLIGLLALISGQGINLGEEAALKALGPLLIIMGFVATTLTITDPIGRLQKVYLLFGNLRREFGYKLLIALTYPIDREARSNFREMKEKDLSGEWVIMSFYNQSESKSFYKYLASMPTFGKELRKILPYSVVLALNPLHLKALVESTRHRVTIPITLPDLENSDSVELWPLLVKVRSMQDTTVRTKWITREIDKITAMVYFVIVISIFILAGFSLKGFIDKFLVNFQGIEQARIILIIFSITVLVAVLIMLIIRLGELKQKSLTIFKYLVERDISKIEENTFAKNLKEIVLYLDNDDWTLAQLSVDETMKAYKEFIRPSSEKILQPRTKEKVMEWE